MTRINSILRSRDINFRNAGRTLLILAVYSFISATPLISKELIGVMPLTNQRYHDRDSWLGYYIQARIKTGLSVHKTWTFHSRQIIQFWMTRSHTPSKISPETTFLITGSFQKVHKYGKFRLVVRNFKSTPTTERVFEKEFRNSTLDQVIDKATSEVGHWISKNFKGKKSNSKLGFESQITEDIYRLREELLDPSKKLSSRRINWLTQKPEIDGENAVFEDLVESLLIIARKVPGKKGKHLLNQVADILNKNLVKYRKSARLRALRGEIYYFLKNFDALEKSADKAVQIDPRDELGLFMLALSKGLSTGEGKEVLAKLFSVNPWVFDSSPAGGHLNYQKGILDSEFKKARLYFQQTIEFKPQN